MHQATENYKANFDAIDWSGVKRSVTGNKEQKVSGHMVMGDIVEFVSPIDGTVISSRSQLRAYEREKGVKQCGNDYTSSEKPSWWDSRGE